MMEIFDQLDKGNICCTQNCFTLSKKTTEYTVTKLLISRGINSIQTKN